ncbi:hypothetical protein M408DRAFT_324252 [Serendipita vermifera MAFF 305830]|uniref:Uncharacterized protein n=1 Tax=Serendipita vermifera MAFF 305830 TaxID=933852 RepID=A0A0C2XMG5_SERVB|nr:hypothetical protein M408DRAFT_324252 [Serendipita vermifera MAFF 305830]
MSQSVLGSLIFQDNSSSPRDFVAVSAQNSAIADLHYEFHTASSQYGNGMQATTMITGKTAKVAPLVVMAQMEWIGRQLGSMKMLVTRPPVEQPMTSLCLPGTAPGSRYFLLDRSNSGMKSQYTWTKNGTTYVLTGPAGEPLARYERSSENSAPNAVLQFYFDDKFLLLMALISLTLNRWLDGPNSPLR